MRRTAGRARTAWWHVAALASLAGRLAGAQGVLPPASGTPGIAGEARTVEGRVLRGGGTPAPVGGQVVVLHRISADTSGPVDSVRTSASGAYRFRYRLEGPRSMYIVSTRHDGVAYFTSPLRERDVRGPDADVLVFDTTSRAFPLSVRARHIVVAPPEPGGVRRVVDVFEVANDSSLTLVGGAGGGATWRVRLPEGARDPSSSGGDMPPEAFRFANGVAELTVPFPPGSRQLVLTYGMPAGGLTVPVDDATATVEVLLEGSGVAVAGAGLAAEAPVAMEGRSFQRFLASQVPAASTFSLRVSGGGLVGRPGRVALLALAALAVALGIVVGRRGRGSPAAPARPGSPDDLAREVAALDHVYAGAEGPARDAYLARRERLMGQLDEAMAVEPGDGGR